MVPGTSDHFILEAGTRWVTVEEAGEVLLVLVFVLIQQTVQGGLIECAKKGNWENVLWSMGL